MNEQISDESQTQYITLKDLVFVLLKGWFLILTTAAVFASVTVIYSLSLKETFLASAFYVEAESSSQGSVSSNLSGLASFAGINMNSGSPGADEALDILNTKKFLSTFVVKRKAIPHLTGVSEKELSELEDSERNQIIRQAALAMRGSIYFAKLPQKALYRLDVYSAKPELAMNWCNWLIADLNESIMMSDVAEAKKSIEFLEKKAMTTTISGLRDIFFTMIESHYQTVMLSEIRKEYVFKTIDPAYRPALKASPYRAKWVIWAFLIGAGTAVFLLLLLDFYGYRLSRLESSLLSLRLVNKKDL